MAEGTPPDLPAFVTRPADPPPALTTRKAGWAYARAMTCPAGHSIQRRDTFLGGSLLIRCGHEIAHRRECGLNWLAVAAVPLLSFHDSPNDRLVYLLEVSAMEARWIQREQPPLHHLLDLFGVTLKAPTVRSTP